PASCVSCDHSFLSLFRRRPCPPLFPYTTLFRSQRARSVSRRACDSGTSFKWLVLRRRDFFLGSPPGSTPAATLVMEELMYAVMRDRKSTRLNSSHVKISYAVFCLKKKNTITQAH